MLLNLDLSAFIDCPVLRTLRFVTAVIGQTISHYRIVDNLGAGNKRTAADLAAAISYFNQAIDKDPAYAVAHLGLADAYTVLPSYGRSPSQDFPKSNAAAPQSPGARPHLGWLAPMRRSAATSWERSPC